MVKKKLIKISIIITLVTLFSSCKNNSYTTSFAPFDPSVTNRFGYDYSLNYSLKDWENSVRAQKLFILQNEEYGIRSFSFETKFSYSLEGNCEYENIVIERYKMSYKECDIRFFVYRDKNNFTKSDAFIHLLHPQKYSVTEEFFDIQKINFAPIKNIVDEGYVYTCVCLGDGAKDSMDGLNNDLFKAFNISRTETSLGVLSMWAYMGSKVLDFLENYSFVNSNRVAVIGHSRGGKAALLAGATDERFYYVISSCAGNSGDALSRYDETVEVGETIKNITDSFPYWFCENYKKYAENERNLPFDQHDLLSLIAPRHLSIGSASNDSWANPERQLLSAKFATQIYHTYGVEGLIIPENFESNTLYGDGNITFHQREGEHGLEKSDWEKYISYFKKI